MSAADEVGREDAIEALLGYPSVDVGKDELLDDSEKGEALGLLHAMVRLTS